MTPKQGLAFVKRHGIVLQAARGPVPSLAEEIAGGPIRGSWWAHAKGGEIFRVADAISESDDVLVCRLVNGNVTYVHRRLWPALVRLAARFPSDRLAKIWEEHTETGAHRARSLPFPEWVPRQVAKDAEKLVEAAAEALLASCGVSNLTDRKRPQHPRRSRAEPSADREGNQVSPRRVARATRGTR